jgi:hypothetical protein
VSLWRPEARRPRGIVALGVDSQSLAWLRNGGASSPAVATGEHRNDVALALAGVRRGTTVDIVAANDLALHWLQTAPALVTSLAELRLVAGARCAHLYGGSAQDWLVAGDWHLGRSFACAALPRATVSAVAQPLEALGLRARWHTAWGVLSDRQANAFASNGWNAVRSVSRVMLWHCRNGEIDCLTSIAVDAQCADREAAEHALQAMQLEATRSNDCPAGVLNWLNLDPLDDSPLPVNAERLGVKWTAPTPDRITDAVQALQLASLLEGGAR